MDKKKTIKIHVHNWKERLAVCIKLFILGFVELDVSKKELEDFSSTSPLVYKYFPEFICGKCDRDLATVFKEDDSTKKETERKEE